VTRDATEIAERVAVLTEELVRLAADRVADKAEAPVGAGG